MIKLESFSLLVLVNPQKVLILDLYVLSGKTTGIKVLYILQITEQQKPMLTGTLKNL